MRSFATNLGLTDHIYRVCLYNLGLYRLQINIFGMKYWCCNILGFITLIPCF